MENGLTEEQMKKNTQLDLKMIFASLNYTEALFTDMMALTEMLVEDNFAGCEKKLSGDEGA